MARRPEFIEFPVGHETLGALSWSGLVGTLVLVGHSMGAFVIEMVAERRPELVRDLVLVDGGTPPATLLADLIEVDGRAGALRNILIG